MRKLEINKGDKYNRLTIIEEVSKKTKRRFLCLCDCGVKKIISLPKIINGEIKSCGCLRLEKALKHGMYGTRIYNIWAGMKTRCNNKDRETYKYYGGRGITYDPKWEIFEGFYEDMKESYKNHFKENNGDTTLERRNGNGNYCKSNCIWATRKEQSRNIKSNVLYKNKCITQWCEDLGLNRNVVFGRINQGGWTAEKALFTKIKSCGHLIKET